MNNITQHSHTARLNEPRLTITFRTYHILLQGEFSYRPVVEIFKWDGELVDNILALPGTPRPTTPTQPEEHVEDVHGGAEPTAPCATFFDGLLASLVVDLPLLGIC